MFVIAVLFCILVALGFLLAWISNVVAREDMEIKTGVIILILAGILGLGAQFFLSGMGEAAGIVGGSLAQFAALVLMINLLGKIDFKKSAIIAAVFTGILWVVGFVLGMMFAS